MRVRRPSYVTAWKTRSSACSRRIRVTHVRRRRPLTLFRHCQVLQHITIEPETIGREMGMCDVTRHDARRAEARRGEARRGEARNRRSRTPGDEAPCRSNGSTTAGSQEANRLRSRATVDGDEPTEDSDGSERERQPEREARRSEERGREKGKEEREREREREREKQIGARSSGKREQTTWSNSVFTSRAVRGSRGHVLIGSWPATGRCTLYVVVVDDGCSSTVSRRDSRGQDSSPSVRSAGFSVETADGARPTMAMMTFGTLVALGKPFPLISLIDGTQQQAAGTSIVVAMPFVMRKVEPRHVCRGHVPAGSHPGWPVGAELEAVANGTLTTSLKQLASLLTVAEDIFANLTAELAQVAERSGHLRHKLDKVEERLCTVDPKKIPVLSRPLRHDVNNTESGWTGPHLESLNAVLTDISKSVSRRISPNNFTVLLKGHAFVSAVMAPFRREESLRANRLT
ncbi:WASF3 protein, partial [Acromyrmex charruanus]